MGGGGTANVVPPYKLREVGPGGKSEIRPIVTVKRSKTTAGTWLWILYYIHKIVKTSKSSVSSTRMQSIVRMILSSENFFVRG